jgi:HK97 family phage prohead protease
MRHNTFVAPLEVKFSTGETGEFSGYAAVFGNIDAHGDIILPGAFTESLREHKARGSKVPMHVMHGVFGGDGIPVGVWKTLEEDDRGLRVEGKISGINTDTGRLLFERVKDGALGGLSIGYKVKKNGATYNEGGAKRALKNLHLGEISLVDDPSNPAAKIIELKANNMDDDFEPVVDKAVDAIGMAIVQFDEMIDQVKCSPKDITSFVDYLRDAHEALTGQRLPIGMTKSTPPIRVIERSIRDEFGVSHTKARAIATRWFGQLPREEGERKAKEEDGSGETFSLLSDFKLPE